MAILNLEKRKLEKSGSAVCIQIATTSYVKTKKPGFLLFTRRLPSQVLFCFVVHQIPHKISAPMDQSLVFHW